MPLMIPAYTTYRSKSSPSGLRLEESGTTYDDLIYSTLDRHLSFSNGVYAWPDKYELGTSLVDSEP
jgi:hypothetical protein